jgi:MarR family
VEETRAQAGRTRSWTLLTGHGHVLVAIAREPEARLRDISARIGLTERAVQLIVADLVAAGYLVRHRAGRRNYYTVNAGSAFRHPDQDGHQVGPFLDLLATAGDADSGPGGRPATPPAPKAASAARS